MARRRKEMEELLEEVHYILNDDDLKLAARVRQAQEILDTVFDDPEDEDEEDEEED